MKTIELTEEQKSKLEEMTKVLFPNENFNYFYSGHDIMSFGLEEIHWYEFCMTHLARAIGNSGRLFDDPISDSTELLSEMIARQEWFNNYHPVDYLYEQFKKLK